MYLNRVRERQPGGLRAQTLVVLLVMACMLPLLALTGFLARAYYVAETERFERGVRDAAINAALAFERELSGTVAALQALATSPALTSGDLETFYKQAVETRPLLGGNVVLRTPDGRQGH
ncbi:hypothetical protein [Falsiroseomonas sp. HW251]|uniref:hypothetical protein n=1 Tax=Falsiroseomonas sp. HW251 TaxID=3390998 RepID=UPI003D316C07